MARKRGARKNLFRHYFVPGAHNAHRPHVLNTSTTLVVAGVIVLLFVVALGMERLVLRSPSSSIAAVVASVLVELANTDRTEDGRNTLVVNPLLERAAQMKADDMAAKGYFAHDSPEGLEPWHWLREAGYAYAYAGENLAVFFSDSREVEQAWMNSPLHRANILSDNFTEIGIALAQGTYEGQKTTFVVQMFGAPAGTSVEAPATVASPVVVNDSPAAESSVNPVVAGASVEGEPAILSPASPSLVWKALTAPATTLQYIYTAIGAFLAMALALLFTAELRRLHIPSFVRGTALIALIVFLFFGGTAYFSGELLIL